MTVQYHDPRAQPMAPAEPYRLQANLSGTVTIGLLANGFPDSAEFLQAVETTLADALPDASFRHYNKGNASIRVPAGMLQSIVSECDLALAAYGH